LYISVEAFIFDKKINIMCETRTCTDCRKELPESQFKKYKKFYMTKGIKKYFMYTIKQCIKCSNERQTKDTRARRQNDDAELPEGHREFYNYENVKCSIIKVNGQTYKLSTKDIELHYTHYVGLSGDLKMNTHFHYQNASEFINKTYEHRMLLFKEVCKMQNKIDSDAAC
jgi:hypothetical protein